MDSILNASLEEICLEGRNGLAISTLWSRLESSLSSSNFSDHGFKQTLWAELRSVPTLKFLNQKQNPRYYSPADSSIQSFQDAEKLDLKLVADQCLRDSFLGLYIAQSSVENMCSYQRRTLERVATARRDGITQSQLSKELGIQGKNYFYKVRKLECQGLIAKRPALVRKKIPGDEGHSSNNLSVSTNLIYLHRYANDLGSQQEVEITKVEQNTESFGNAKEIPASGDGFSGNGVKDNVLVNDYLSATKAVCDKLKESNGKVLVSDLKKELGYSGTRSGNRAWRKICCRLEAAHIVKKFEAQVNEKVEQYLVLLKKFCPKSLEPKNLGQVKIVKKYQTAHLLAELPIEHQIQELINAAGSEGIIMSNISKRLGIGRKESDKWIESMCSRFGMIKRKERNKKVNEYRVWERGKCNFKSAKVFLNQSENDNTTTTTTTTPYVSYVDTLDRTDQIQSTLTETETHDAASDTPLSVLNPHLTLTVDSARKEESMLEQDKGAGLQSQKSEHASWKRNRSSKASSVEFTEVEGVTGRLEEQMLDKLPVTVKTFMEGRNLLFTFPGEHDAHLHAFQMDGHQETDQESGTKDTEGCHSILSMCDFSKLKPSRQFRFSWTEEADRQLVIQYARWCATLGAKYHHQINWASLPDLPAPPSTCKRRMSYLKNSNGKFRKALMKLCNMLSERYAMLLLKTQNGSLNISDCRQLFQGSAEEGYNKNCSNISDRNQRTGFREKLWDDFDDKNIRKSLDEILHHRMTKMDATKRDGSTCEAGSDHSTNSEEYDPQGSELIVPSVPSDEIQNDSRGISAQRCVQHLHQNFFKLLHEGVVSAPIYKSLAVELFKLVFLSTITARGEQNLPAEIQQRYSEHDLLAALDYLRDNKIVVGGTDSQPLSLSPQFFSNIFRSPFPTDSGKRAAKLARWLREREKDLTEGGIHLSTDLKCGDFFHLFALVSSGQLSISSHIPDGVGEAEDLRSSKRKTGSAESLNSKRLKYSSDNLSRREKGYPGIMVSVYLTSSTSKSVNLLKDDGASSGKKHVSGNNHVEQTGSVPEGCMEDKMCAPTLPWMNGEQKINKIFDKGLKRRLLGIVMQNPGMLEDEIIRKMDVLNPQSCRKLMELMVLDKHLHVRKLHQTVYSGPPPILRTLIGSSSAPPKEVVREHFFANSVSAGML
ncbi:hypothetical protein PS2_008210 [Malus domestica]|nr:uncharacterized protein LOC103449266 isoform X1 [Malus domestica]